MATRRINFNVSEQTYNVLQKLADEKGTTVANVLRDAIALENWFKEAQRDGGRILVERKGKAREVIRR